MVSPARSSIAELQHRSHAPSPGLYRDTTVKRVDTTQLQSTRLEVVLQTVDERSSRLKVL
jgi:uncharacterized linocin/CFP29 family protein